MVPTAETTGRRERLRAAVPQPTLVVHGRPNVRYLTGYDGGGATPFLVLRDERALLVHYTADEDSVAALADDGIELVPYAPHDDPLAVLAATLGAGPVAIDASWFTVPEEAALRSRGHQAHDCSAVLSGLRAVKSPWEQDRLRAAGRITTATMAHLEAMARAGAGPRELASELCSTSLRLGAGPGTSVAYVAVGDATMDNHVTWDWHDRQERPEQAAGPYLFEFATAVEGYACPLSRSATTDERGQAALDAVRAGVDDVVAGLVPGAGTAGLHARMVTALGSAGFSFAHRAGYSIGLGEAETWMEPSVALLGPHGDQPVQAGMAFHVVGSVVERGRFGVAHSASVLVGPSGAEVLAG